MAHSTNTANSKWTSYPCLLPTLEDSAQQNQFEAACYAQHCGRFEHATAIYSTDLPASQMKPILALQRADMLTLQGSEHARIDLLERALGRIPPDTETINVARIRLLMNLMLADAEFWAEGLTEPAMISIAAVKEHFQEGNIGVQGLDDVQVRIIILFHQLAISLRRVSNLLGKTYDAIFTDSWFDTATELNRLRKQLHQENRLQAASQFLLLELEHTTSGKLKETLVDAMSLCEELEQSGIAPLQVRAIGVKRKLYSMTKSEDKESSLWIESFFLLSKIKPKAFPTWQACLPSLDLESTRYFVIRSERPPSAKVRMLLGLAAKAKQQLDYTQANHCYIEARNISHEWLRTAQGQTEIDGAMRQLYDVHKIYQDFHENVSCMYYFAGSATVDYLHTLRLGHKYTEMVKIARDFTDAHPNFAIPLYQERIHDARLTATRKLDLKREEKELKASYRPWLLKCPFWTAGAGLSEEALLDPSFYVHEINNEASDTMSWGKNAVGLMLKWAAWEWDAKLLSWEHLRLLFGDKLGHRLEAPRNPVQVLKSKEIKSAVNESLLVAFDGWSDGVDGGLENTETFMTQYVRLKRWALLDKRPPSRGARIVALRTFLEACLFRLRDTMCSTEEKQPSPEQARKFEATTGLLNELRSLETATRDAISVDEEKASAVRITLVKSFARKDSGAAGLVTDDELIERLQDCSQLTIQARDARQPLRQYHFLCQRMRLIWQRHVQCSRALRDTVEEIMLRVNEAQDVFFSVRGQIVGLDAPDSLVASVKLADDFQFREHHNFALLGRLLSFNHYAKLYRNSENPDFYNQAVSDVLNLAMWARRSKGAGFSDLLNLESQTQRAIEEAQQAELGSSPEVSSAIQQQMPHVLSPRYPEWVRVPQFREMLNTLPPNTVIVDIINVPYVQGGPTMYALVYRRQQMTNPPIPIPVLTMAGINIWVKKNLNVEEDDSKLINHLGNADAEAKLAELTGLLTPLLTTLPQYAIQPGETIVFCPTGLLNRIPLHAIPTEEGGPPLIERNPVVYCQSLTLLHWLYQKTVKASSNPHSPKAAVINPLPESAASTSRVKDLARALQAEESAFHHGEWLDPQTVWNAARDCTVLHYHGHVVYQPGAALETHLALNEAALLPILRKRTAARFLAGREFFRSEARLAQPALVTIIGCGSSLSGVSTTDDLLGLPTALFYAGMTAMVGTLWPLDDEDGAAFGTTFYGALFEERDAVLGRVEAANLDKRQQQEEIPEASAFFTRAVDLAKVFQQSILRLRHDDARQDRKAPYNWASFTLNGFWFLPISSLPMATPAVDRQG
ncbi:hypothetical protein N7520_004405 [Penicillium odoratum]|uniref:uncharacterized protein n=1 Tax=Penicillium odoratum TaxID=1167516 RepID=UPI002549420C|nr:uncharacterized protein N7520_004405 [Penicillium odoratum]KAJ5764846.1 hypothetical protein N7520_004405 [Penicillium odoratum]